MRYIRVSKIATIIALAVVLSACPKDPYRAAIQGSDDVASSVSAAVKIATSYYGSALIDDQEKAQVADYLNLVTNGNMAFRHCVVAAHTAQVGGATAYVACADAFITQVRNVNPSTFHFKNPKSQAELSNYLQAVATAINGISLAIENSKPSPNPALKPSSWATPSSS